MNVIHTDGDYQPCGKKIRGLGLLEPVGHFDFYPSDGGQHQSGCDSRYLWGSIGFAETSCNHDRAVLYYLHRWARATLKSSVAECKDS